VRYNPAVDKQQTQLADDPDDPRVLRCGEVADAEPALLGWTMPVDDLFA
jgi:hypothetical protein